MCDKADAIVLLALALQGGEADGARQGTKKKNLIFRIDSLIQYCISCLIWEGEADGTRQNTLINNLIFRIDSLI